MRDYDYVRTGQVEPPTAVQPPVRPAPDRPGDRDARMASALERGMPTVLAAQAIYGQQPSPGDRDQQQAAEVLAGIRLGGIVANRTQALGTIAEALAAARAEEAARWQAKIEALADEWETRATALGGRRKRPARTMWHYATRLRAVLDGERR